MNFPTDEKYLDFVESLNKHKLRLTCGNCGIFAFALKEVFDDGMFYNVGGFAHVLLERDNKFYDGERIYNSINDLEGSRWGEWFDDDDDPYRLNEEDPETAYEEIQRETSCSLGKEYFIELMKEKFEIEE